MYKYISLLVSVFCWGLSAWSHTVFFLHSIPLGLLPAFLICPLFPLNSPGYFPRNTSAPCFFFFSSMSRLLMLLAHVENTWHLLHVCIMHLPNNTLHLIHFSSLGMLAHKRLENETWLPPQQRKASCDCCRNRSPAQSATSRLHITPAISLVKLLHAFYLLVW